MRTTLILAAVLIHAPAEAAGRFSIYIQSPFAIGDSSRPDLGDIESAGASAPFFSRTVDLPIAPAVANLDASLPKGNAPISGVAVCADPCPDVAWSVTPYVSVTLLQAPDPVVRNIGPSGAARVEITATATVRVDASAAIRAEFVNDIVGFLSGGSVDVNPAAYVVLTGRGKATVDLWPQPATPGLEVAIELVDSNIELALNDEVVPRTAAWGAIGFGALSIPGGPLLGALVGGLLGDEAADAAEDEIRARYRREIERAVRQANDLLTQEVQGAIAKAVANLPNLELLVNETVVPGLDTTIGELNAAFGGRFEVHTVGRGSTLVIGIVHRFDPPPGDAGLAIDLLLPKEICRFIIMGDGAAKGLVISAERVPINEDLASRIGTACGNALGGDPVVRHAFLGADPQAALGAGAEARTVWAPDVGSASAAAILTDVGDAYRCRIEFTAFPPAAIVEFGSSGVSSPRLGLGNRGRRVLMAPLPSGGTVFLDERLSPVQAGDDGNAVLKLGGPLTHCSGTSSAGGAPAGSLAERIAEAIDPENCINCGTVDLARNIRIVTNEAVVRLGGAPLVSTNVPAPGQLRLNR